MPGQVKGAYKAEAIYFGPPEKEKDVIPSQEIFDAYNRAPPEGRTHDGRPVPPFTELGPAVQGKWQAAALRAAELVLQEESSPPMVRLITRDGEPVTSVKLPPFIAGPRVILWGTRVFVREPYEAAVYREAFAYTAVE